MKIIFTKIFLKNISDTKNAQTIAGMRVGIFGIVCNVSLFLAKLFAGIGAASVSIIADAINNLSDALSSVITYMGFKLSAQKPDNDHPFGHGRSEYIAAFIVSMLIIFMGFEIIRDSINALISRRSIEVTVFSIIIMCASITLKAIMYIVYKTMGKQLTSPVLLAASKDSISDCYSTLAIIAGILIFHFTHINLDGYLGIAVGVMIFITGIKTTIETISPLLGTLPQAEYVNKIKAIVMGFDNILGTHDIIVHDYGQKQKIISLHAEVPADCNILEIHDNIDLIERKLLDELDCMATIHIDPIVTDDEELNAVKIKFIDFAFKINAKLTLHDFRMVRGLTHTNIIFDVVRPNDFMGSDAELIARFCEFAKGLDEMYRLVIQVDRGYV